MLRFGTNRAPLITLAATFCFASSLFAASFTATLDRDTVGVGESATLTLSFEGGTPKATPIIPAVKNLRITSSGIPTTSTQSHFNLNTGQFTSSTTYILTYSVTPLQPGDYLIPNIKADVGGQTLTNQPLKLKASAVSAENQLASMRIVLPKKELFVGEVMTLELQLYLSSVIQNITDVKLSPIRSEGFNAGEAVKGGERDTPVGNSMFHVVQILIPLTTVKGGKFSLGSIDCSMTLQLPSNPRSRDPFDQFFSRSQLSRKTVSSQPENLVLFDLPKQNVPANFKGTVGNYSMNVTATPTNVTVGDPITVKIQIAGRGALDSLTLPEQTAWRDFKTYPPTSKVDATDKFNFQGTKTFEQIIVPQNPDIAELPPISFSFFNSDERKYVTLTNAPIGLIVKPSGSLPLSNLIPSSQPDNSQSAPDIVPIKRRLGPIERTGAPLITQGWFLATQTIPVFAFLGLVAWRKRNENLANNPRLRRQLHVANAVRQGLHELKYFAAENYAEEFFATLFRLLQEQLGERLDVPASSITEAVVEEQLRPRGTPDEILASLRELFQACNQARYAPGQKHGELQSLIPKVETTFAELQKLKLK